MSQFLGRQKNPNIKAGNPYEAIEPDTYARALIEAAKKFDNKPILSAPGVDAWGGVLGGDSFSPVEVGDPVDHDAFAGIGFPFFVGRVLQSFIPTFDTKTGLPFKDKFNRILAEFMGA